MDTLFVPPNGSNTVNIRPPGLERASNKPTMSSFSADSLRYTSNPEIPAPTIITSKVIVIMVSCVFVMVIQ